MSNISRGAMVAVIVLASTSVSLGGGSWITSKEGVKLWDPNPMAFVTCSWTGRKDANGYATGKGLVVWYLKGKVYEASTCTYFLGRPISDTIAISASGNTWGYSTTGKKFYSVKLVPKSSTSAATTSRLAKTSKPRTSYKPSMRTAKKPVTRPRPTSDKDLKDVKDALDTVKSGVELYNELNKHTPSKKSADLVVKSVSVRSTKANGNAWDSGRGKPDLKVVIRRGLFGSLDTGAKNDSTYASYNKKRIRVSEGDTISIDVYDQDAFADDLAGSYSKKITAETLKQRRVTWSFDQVTALVVEFEW